MRQKKPVKEKERETKVHTTRPTIVDSILGGFFYIFTLGSGSSISHNIFRSPIQTEEKKDCKEILQIYDSLCKDKINYSFEEDNQCEHLWKEMKKYC